MMNANYSNNIKSLEHKLKERFYGEATGHDYFHILRVRDLALHICQEEKGCDKEFVELLSLLHDVNDHKFQNETSDSLETIVAKFLEGFHLNKEIQNRLVAYIPKISFSKNKDEKEDVPLAVKIVRDADRLDAIGAIGVARAFAYGGKKNQPIYLGDDTTLPTTIQHFYDKLLQLPSFMHTETGRKLAKERFNFMEAFLKQFFNEWMIR